jgi:hypothetical protein
VLANDETVPNGFGLFVVDVPNKDGVLVVNKDGVLLA